MDEAAVRKRCEELYNTISPENNDYDEDIARIAIAIRAAYADGKLDIAKDLNGRIENCFKILSDGRILTNTESVEWRARLELLKSLREEIWKQAQAARGE